MEKILQEQIKRLNVVIETLHDRIDQLEEENKELRGENCKIQSWKYKYYNLIKEHKKICEELKNLKSK